MGKLDYLKRYAVDEEQRKQPEAVKPKIPEKVKNPTIQKDEGDNVTYRLGLRKVTKAEWEAARTRKKKEEKKAVCELSNEQKRLLNEERWVEGEFREDDPVIEIKREKKKN
jgi:hypothetical protein